MKYKFLNHMHRKELEELKNIILGIQSSQELLDQIESNLRTTDIKNGNYNFTSSYIPNYDRKLDKYCTEVLSQIKVNDLSFFLESFKNKGNTHYAYPSIYFYKEFEDKIILNNLTILLDLVSSVHQCYKYNLSYPDILYFDKVDDIFKINLFQEDFEGPYNMLNYIKSYIYSLLKQKKEVTAEDIFLNYSEKKRLVTIQLKDISSYLYEIRNGTNLRLCIHNMGLSRMVNKTGDQLSLRQSLYVDALAFGTTLEKIEDKNYEDYQKLLYLPSGKSIR